VKRHVSAEVLALHREGEVSPRRAERITAHLSVCAVCTEVNDDLGTVTTVLVATQLAPMPESIADRIQLAIAQEAAIRAATVTAAVTAAAADASGTAVSSVAGAGVSGAGVSGAGASDVFGEAGLAGSGTGSGGGAGREAGSDTDKSGHVSGRPDLPERRGGRSRRFRMPNWSSPLLLRGLAAAGGVVIIAGAGLLFAHGQSGSNGSSSGSGGAGHAASRPLAPNRSIRANGTGAGYSGVNSPVNLHYRLKGRIADARALASGHDYSMRNMGPLIHKEVASTTEIGKGATPGPGQLATPARATFGGVRILTLTACLTRLAAGRAILIADVARYLGQPATIVVLRPSAKAHELNVVVVRLTCSAASPEIIAQVTIPAG
jgi:hypothetical protein